MTNKLQQRYRQWLWSDQPLSHAGSILRAYARLAAAFAHDIQQAEISLRAMSLVYTTILSLVPMLAFCFSLLKAFGVHDRMAPLLQHFLQPIGDQAGELTGQILIFVNNLDVALLGFVGLVLLIYTMLRLMYKVQKSLDHTWEINETPQLGKRIADYLTMLLVGPLLLLSLLAAASGLNESLLATEVLNISFISSLYAWFLFSLPSLLIAVGLTFVYWFMPNCRVKFLAAGMAGLISSFLWKGSGVLFAYCIASSSQYKIYAGFASAMLFLVWLYLSWLIFLFGSRLAFYFQYPEQMRPESKLAVSGGQMMEKAGLSVLACIARNHYNEKPPMSRNGLSRELQLAHTTLQPLLTAFEKDGLISKNNHDSPGYLPAVPFEEIPISRALHLIRTLHTKPFLHGDPKVSDILDQMDQLIDERFEVMTLKNLVK